MLFLNRAHRILTYFLFVRDDGELHNPDNRHWVDLYGIGIWPDGSKIVTGKPLFGLDYKKDNMNLSFESIDKEIGIR